MITINLALFITICVLAGLFVLIVLFGIISAFLVKDDECMDWQETDFVDDKGRPYTPKHAKRK